MTHTEVIIDGCAYLRGCVIEGSAAVVIEQGHPVVALGLAVLHEQLGEASTAAAFTPAQARELALTLLDAAQTVELREGTYDPHHDPFESHGDPFESALAAQQQALPFPL